MTTICLSPHLDDAVLSVGALLAERRRQGERVVVINLFTASPAMFRSGPFRFRARALEAERAQEEQAAMVALGVEHQNLGLLDAPFRDRRYRAYHRLMGPIPPWEKVEAEALARLEPLLRGIQPCQVLAPLGVGGHVDHQLTHRLGRMLERLVPVSFYEDIPYALVPHALRRRLRDLGVELPYWQPSIHAVATDVRRHFERHPVYLAQPAWQRQLAGVAIGLWAAQTERRSRVQRGEPWALRPEVMTVSAEALEQKLEAIACYESQVPTLFASMRACEEALRSYAATYMTTPQPYGERLWLPSAPDCVAASEQA